MQPSLTDRNVAMTAARARHAKQTARQLVPLIFALSAISVAIYDPATGYVFTPDDRRELAEYCRVLAYAEAL